MDSVFSVINFLGGIALFLYSLQTMSKNLESISSKKIKETLKKLTNTPFKGVLVGTIITGITQSSTAVSVMTIGLVNAGLMNLSQAIGIIMGANIGTCFTAQLIAFNLTDISYLCIMVGVTLIFLNKNKSLVRWGYIVLSFGLLFVGLDMMKHSVAPLKEWELVHKFLSNPNPNPFIAILTGMVFTMIIQSSTAVTGIVIVLGINGIISPMGAMYLIFGTEIGTTLTAWIASITTNRTGKRVALFHTLFNVYGVICVTILTIYNIYPIFVNWITPGDVLHEFSKGDYTNMARFIANSQLCFNIFNVIIVFPFIKSVVGVCEKIIKNTDSETIYEGEPKHLDLYLLQSTEMAVEQSIKEMGEMIRLVSKSLELSMDSYITKSYKNQERIEKIENAIDHLQREVTLYLVAVSERSTSRRVSQKIPSLLHSINDIEKLGDFAEQINNILNNQILAQTSEYHHEFNHIIIDKHQKVLYLLDLLQQYLEKNDNDISNKIYNIENVLKVQHTQLRSKILTMIQSAECDAVSGINTIDYIDSVEELCGKINNIILAASRDFVYFAVERPKSDRVIFNIDQEK